MVMRFHRGVVYLYWVPQDAGTGRLVAERRLCPCLHDALSRVLLLSASSNSLDQVSLGIPLQIIWTRILVFSIRAEGTDVSWRIVYQTVSDHLVFPFKSFSAFTSRATFDGTVVWPIRGVHICM